MDQELAKAIIKEVGLERLQKSLRRWREDVHLTQDELASLSGIAQETISRLESGARKLNPRIFVRIVSVIDKRYDELQRASDVTTRNYVPLRSLLGGQDTKDWFSQKEQRLHGAEKAKATQERIKDRLIQALDELVNIQNELIAAHAELRQVETKKREDLEKRIAEYRDLLGLETDAAIARSNADEQREKILTGKGKEEK
jgi:transcriptional regulator with XRE-family HTH domain